MVNIRLAEVEDSPELKKLNDLFNGEGCNTIKAIEESLIRNKSEIVCVAVEGNNLIGFCCGRILTSMCYSYNYGEITELYVIEEYRRQGIGKKLLMLMENEFNKLEINHLHVFTGMENKIAQKLYRSCGYKNTSEIMFDKN